MARALGTSARSLQRRLSAAGTSFQNLIDSTRREAATRYLQDSKIPSAKSLICWDTPSPLHSTARSNAGTASPRRNFAPKALKDPPADGTLIEAPSMGGVI